MTTGALRRLAAGAGVFVLLLLGLIGVGGLAATPAAAASADSYDSYDITATLGTDGTVAVTETFTIRFGSNSGRHGPERTLITREADPDTGQDLLFPVDQVTAESLTPGVSGQLNVTQQRTSAREQYVRIRIGDPDRTVSQPAASYRLSYRIGGLMRASTGYDELYWDLTGSTMPQINSFTAAITVPGGAQDVFCSVAAPRSSGACDTAAPDSSGVARFSHASIAKGELATVSVKVAAGLVSPNTPIFAENGETAEARTAAWVQGGSAAAGAGVGLAGWLFVRRRTGDERFLDLPPGVLPARGATGQVGRNPRDLEVPVSFSPPKLPLAEAGLLLDGAPDVRHTTATLVGLAVAGAIRLRSEDPPEARLVDASRAPDEPSSKLLRRLFPDGREVADLSTAGSMTQADHSLAKAARRRASEQHWFLPTLSAPMLSLAFMVAAGLGVGAFYLFGGWAMLAWPLGLAVVVTWLLVQRQLAVPRRSAVGRALTDQVEGFRTYIATAEAAQLEFEEGEDIFSRYLPWAVLFGLAERWTAVCQELVAMGRLPDLAPAWYYGSTWDLHLMSWQLNSMGHHIETAVAPPPPSFSSDSGFGSGGSAFGGGGGF
ncbi:MAG TPA: DUF2207 domain-containing protein, partial [Propionicimonas sp.]|nr:DUF2207 domain-containing protein [Propionicimonas sp.]